MPLIGALEYTDLLRGRLEANIEKHINQRFVKYKTEKTYPGGGPPKPGGGGKGMPGGPPGKPGGRKPGGGAPGMPGGANGMGGLAMPPGPPPEMAQDDEYCMQTR